LSIAIKFFVLILLAIVAIIFVVFIVLIFYCLFDDVKIQPILFICKYIIVFFILILLFSVIYN
jgi:hypothetical protein